MTIRLSATKNFRTTPEEKELWDEAAQAQGLPTGTWLRFTANKKAKAELRAARREEKAARAQPVRPWRTVKT